MRQAIVQIWWTGIVLICMQHSVHAYFDHDAYFLELQEQRRLRGRWGWDSNNDNNHENDINVGSGMTDRDHEIIQNLFDAAAAGLIERHWQFDGVNKTTTSTYSAEAQVSEWIREHVTSMMERVHNSGSILRPWDPLFAALFEHHHEINQTLNDTYVEKGKEGVQVTETGITHCGIDLAQFHAAAVSDFIKLGHSTLREEHEAPKSCTET